jgi:hypothetical protein
MNGNLPLTLGSGYEKRPGGLYFLRRSEFLCIFGFAID